MDKKVAIITGSESGIGRQTAILFSGQGINVVVTGLFENSVNEVVKECNDASTGGVVAIGVTGDITNVADAIRLINTAVEKFGRIDILVNNAGAVVQNSLLDDDLMEKYDRIMNTNVKAMLHLCHLAAPHLTNTKGCIVNVGSIAGIRPTISIFLYCTSKAAVNMLTKCLALELGPKGVRVNCVNPSYIRTDFRRNQLGMSDEMIASKESHIKTKHPLRRIGLPADVAKAISFLASDDASFITGECMLVDGGGMWPS